MGQRLTIAAGIAASLALLGWLVGSHWDQLLTLWVQARADFLCLALASSAAAYLFLGAAQWEVLRLLGYPVRYREVAAISMSAQAANLVVGFSGATGLALRAHQLKRRGVPFGKTLTLAVVSNLCMSATLSLLAAQGLAICLIRLSEGPLPWTGSSISVALPMLLAFGLAAAMYHHKLRSRWSEQAFRAVNRVVFTLSRRQIPEHHFETFDRDLTNGLRLIWQKRGHLTRAVAFVCCDWLCTFGVLFFAFRALGVDAPAGPLLLGFALGIVTTSIPFVPGGLGVMEGAVAGLLYRFDVDFDAALLATLVFRAFYHLLPIAVSLTVYPWLDAKGRTKNEKALGGLA